MRRSTARMWRSLRVPEQLARAGLDSAAAIQAALEVPLERLPSRCETFFTFPETPHHKFNSEKTRRILGWEPRYTLETLWNKEPMTPPDHLQGAW